MWLSAGAEKGTSGSGKSVRLERRTASPVCKRGRGEAGLAREGRAEAAEFCFRKLDSASRGAFAKSFNCRSFGYHAGENGRIGANNLGVF